MKSLQGAVQGPRRASGVPGDRRARAASAWLVQLCLVLTGCASVRIENADVVERRYPGFVVLSITPRPDAAAIVRSRGLGLVAGVSGVTLGYLDESAFISFDARACRLFIAVETQEQVDAVVRALASEGRASELCVVNKREAGK